MRVFVTLALTLALLSAVVLSPLPLLTTRVMFDEESSNGCWAVGPGPENDQKQTAVPISERVSRQ